MFQNSLSLSPFLCITSVFEFLLLVHFWTVTNKKEWRKYFFKKKTFTSWLQLDITTVVRSSARLMNILPFSRAFQGEKARIGTYRMGKPIYGSLTAMTKLWSHKRVQFPKCETMIKFTAFPAQVPDNPDIPATVYFIWTIPALTSFWIFCITPGFLRCACAARGFSCRSVKTCMASSASPDHHQAHLPMCISNQRETSILTCCMIGSVRMFWISGSCMALFCIAKVTR